MEIEIASPLPAAEVLRRLDAFGKDWRESRLPQAARSATVYACEVVITGSEFFVRLRSNKRGRAIVWRGVVRTGVGEGSQLSATWQFAPIGLFNYLFLAAVAVFIYRDLGLGTAVFLMAFAVIAPIAGGPHRATFELPFCREILATVASESEANAVSTAEPRKE